jgi:hypothetical protein
LKVLPVELREAFDSQDIQKLQNVLSLMDPLEAKKYMKMCVDSGLWVAKDNSIFNDDNDDNNNEEENDNDHDEGVDGNGYEVNENNNDTTNDDNNLIDDDDNKDEN